MNRRLALILMGVVWAAPAFGAKQTYVHSRVGSALDKVGATTTAGTVLMGGGTDVDAAFQWMCGPRAAAGTFWCSGRRAPTPTILTSSSCARA